MVGGGAPARPGDGSGGGVAISGVEWGCLPSIETPGSPELGPRSRPSAPASSGLTSRDTMVNLPFKVLSAQPSASRSKPSVVQDCNAPSVGRGRRIRDSRAF